ncbi:hypothetical protein [Yinghuangia seranimata]|uniref:hypothetical protein n=1 Tax=Yinghuangia seranimata TaxID=408067 RepID=UPI00248BE0DB|nr:hypothetical protein [Yinghuangia seranimata]MDI2126671.1 hypothetical protein [Yinghuangia seranimata]
MGLLEDFRKAYDGALLTVDWLERSVRLDAALDAVLKPWVRERIAAWEDTVRWCDYSDIAHAFDGLAAIAPQYADLRRDLAADSLGRHRPEAPWRTIDRIRIELVRHPVAVRARTRSRHPHPRYTLRLVKPAMQAARVETWEFRVLTPAPGGPDAVETFTVTVVPDRQTQYGTLHVPPELAEHGVWHEELWFAFDALGRKMSEPSVGTVDASDG